MSLNLKLQMRLSQQLIMTPQLQQAIKLLQLSRNELEDLIQQALIENPVLDETTEDDEGGPAPVETTTEPTVDLQAEGGDMIASDVHAENDQEWQEYIQSGSGIIPERNVGPDGDDMGFESTLASDQTLQEYVRWQLEMSPLGPLEMEIGEYIIGNLDDDGYLSITIRELLEGNPDLHKRIAKALRKGGLTLAPLPGLAPDRLETRHIAGQPVEPKSKKKAPPVFEEDQAAEAAPARPAVQMDPAVGAQVDAVLRMIQTFDPIAVGSRDLQECLEIQLIAMGLEDALPYRIVHNDLKLLEKKDLRRIARRQKSELEDVIAAYKLIMSLEPKPGRPYNRERPQHIIPDVYIYKSPSDSREGEDRVGQYRVALNNGGIPRLKINDYYRQLGENGTPGSALTQEYIQEKIKAGNWLMKSIEQRQKTIFRVTKSILKHQYEFFDNGINDLRPLVLKDVAEDIDVHESTVSRITTNKYVHTPQGIFELKYFFTSGIDQGSGEVISSKKIKDMIQKIITAEDPREPLTDIQIAEILSKESKIKVARRTVAKYREALNLLPSNKRKQLF